MINVKERKYAWNGDDRIKNLNLKGDQQKLIWRPKNDLNNNGQTTGTCANYQKVYHVWNWNPSRIRKFRQKNINKKVWKLPKFGGKQIYQFRRLRQAYTGIKEKFLKTTNVITHYLLQNNDLIDWGFLIKNPRRSQRVEQHL